MGRCKPSPIRQVARAAVEKVTEVSGSSVTKTVRPRRRHGEELCSGLRCLILPPKRTITRLVQPEPCFRSANDSLSLLTFFLVRNSCSEALIVRMGSQQRDDEINVLVTGFLVSFCPSSSRRLWSAADSVALVTHWPHISFSLMAI